MVKFKSRLQKSYSTVQLAPTVSWSSTCFHTHSYFSHQFVHKIPFTERMFKLKVTFREKRRRCPRQLPPRVRWSSTCSCVHTRTSLWWPGARCPDRPRTAPGSAGTAVEPSARPPPSHGSPTGCSTLWKNNEIWAKLIILLSLTVCLTLYSKTICSILKQERTMCFTETVLVK